MKNEVDNYSAQQKKHDKTKWLPDQTSNLSIELISKQGLITLNVDNVKAILMGVNVYRFTNKINRPRGMYSHVDEQ